MSTTRPARRKDGASRPASRGAKGAAGRKDRSPSRPRTAPRPLRANASAPSSPPNAPGPDALAAYPSFPDGAVPGAPDPEAPGPVPSPKILSGDQTPLLPGAKPVLELLLRSPERVDVVFLRKGRHSKDMDRIADLCRGAGVRFSLLEAPAFARVYSGHSQGIVARLYETGYCELEELLARAVDAPLPLLLALDQVQDPGNAGTLARTLYALGGGGLITPRHNGVYLGAAAAKAAAGALELLPVSRVANLGHALEAAREAGYAVYGASSRSPAGNADPGGREKTGAEAARTFAPVLDAFAAELALPAVLVLGGEENGLRPGTEKRCERLLRIPLLRDCDSLNVAQAGGILIACFARLLPTGRKAGTPGFFPPRP